jgi:hypothetical protein
MKNIVGNLWNYAGDPKFILCITVNGFVKKNGEAVMGRGCALEAAQRYPQLPKELGAFIQKNGNVCSTNYYPETKQTILTFPVKHNWWEKADLELIKRSTETLRLAATSWLSDSIFILPKPGCKNGGLDWSEVEPIVSTLPDNVWCIDFK